MESITWGERYLQYSTRDIHLLLAPSYRGYGGWESTKSSKPPPPPERNRPYPYFQGNPPYLTTFRILESEFSVLIGSSVPIIHIPHPEGGNPILSLWCGNFSPLMKNNMDGEMDLCPSISLSLSLHVAARDTAGVTG